MAFGLWAAQNQLRALIPRRRAFCQRLGNVMFDIDQLQKFTISSGLYHYSILP